MRSERLDFLKELVTECRIVAATTGSAEECERLLMFIVGLEAKITRLRKATTNGAS
jgi:hypothetical protein